MARVCASKTDPEASDLVDRGFDVGMIPSMKRSCDHCEAEFEPFNRRMRFCSNACRYKWFNKIKDAEWWRVYRRFKTFLRTHNRQPKLKPGYNPWMDPEHGILQSKQELHEAEQKTAQKPNPTRSEVIFVETPWPGLDFSSS